MRSRSYARPQTVLPAEVFANHSDSSLGDRINPQPSLKQHLGEHRNRSISRLASASAPSTFVKEDGNSSFEVFLADQLQRLQKVFTTQHRQELASVHENKSKFQDNKDIWRASPARKQPPCVEHMPRGRLTPFMASKGSVSELSCATSSHSKSPVKTEVSSDAAPGRFYSDMSLGLHPIFKPNGHQNADGTKDSVPLCTSTVVGPGAIRAGDERKDDGWPMNYLRPLVTHPLIQDLFAMLLVWYDLLMIPMELSELVHSNSFLEIVITCVWMLDLFFNFLKGYEEHGVVDHSYVDYSGYLWWRASQRKDATVLEGISIAEVSQILQEAKALVALSAHVSI